MNDDSNLEFGLPPRRDIPEDVRERITSAVEKGMAKPQAASRGSWLQVAGVAAAVIVVFVSSQVLPGAAHYTDGRPDFADPYASQRSHLTEQAEGCSTPHKFVRLGASITAEDHPEYAQALMIRDDGSATVCYDYIYKGSQRGFSSAEHASYGDVNDNSPVAIITISPGAEDFKLGLKKVFIAGITTRKVENVLFIPPEGPSIRAVAVDGTFVVRAMFDSAKANSWHVEAYDHAGRRLARGSLSQYDQRYGH